MGVIGPSHITPYHIKNVKHCYIRYSWRKPMALEQLAPNLYGLALGPINTFLVVDADGLTLIDTGAPGSEGAILGAIAELGKQPSDLRRIVLTHCHPDHAGSAAALQKAT